MKPFSTMFLRAMTMDPPDGFGHFSNEVIARSFPSGHHNLGMPRSGNIRVIGGHIEFHIGAVQQGKVLEHAFIGT